MPIAAIALCLLQARSTLVEPRPRPRTGKHIGHPDLHPPLSSVQDPRTTRDDVENGRETEIETFARPPGHQFGPRRANLPTLHCTVQQYTLAAPAPATHSICATPTLPGHHCTTEVPSRHHSRPNHAHHPVCHPERHHQDKSGSIGSVALHPITVAAGRCSLRTPPSPAQVPTEHSCT